MTWFLDLRADSVGGNPAREVTVRQDADHCFDIGALVEEARGRHVLFGTHGFNVNRSEGIASLSSWSDYLQLGDDALFVGVLWPGDSRWAPVVDYPFEGGEAVDSGRLLAPFLDQHFTQAVSVSFASHSLGARMVLETIRNLILPVRRLILMAGAIDDNCLIKEYQDAAAKVNEISVLASRGDYVLKLAFPLGNPLSAIIGRGHPYWQGALGCDGPDAPAPGNVRYGWQILDEWKYGHGDYLDGAPPPSTPPVDRPQQGQPAPGSRSDSWGYVRSDDLSGTLPVDVPRQGEPTPKSKPAWSAGFVSTRFR